MVANTNSAPDGTKRQLFGERPTGILVLEANGRYAHVFTRAGRPKFKANNRMQGTPDEIKAAWEGGVAHFGTWSVSEADKALLLRVDGSLYPNQGGTVDKRVVSNVTADELQMLNASSAGGTTEATFRRVK